MSNNDDYDNGLIKSTNDEIDNNKNIKNNTFICSVDDDKTLESVKDYEKILLDENILNYIEDKIGYNKKYLKKCLKKNVINYSTATYYLKLKEKTNENNKFERELFYN